VSQESQDFVDQQDQRGIPHLEVSQVHQVHVETEVLMDNLVSLGYKDRRESLGVKDCQGLKVCLDQRAILV
jgi:hypothetical protein